MFSGRGSTAVVFSISRPATGSSSKTVPVFFELSTSSASSPTASFVSCTGNDYSYSRLFFSAPRSIGSDSPPSAAPSAISASWSSVFSRKTSHQAGRPSRQPSDQVTEQSMSDVVQARG